MAERADCAVSTIRDRFKVLGIPNPTLPPPPNRLSDDRLREIAAAGLVSFTEMERVYGHSRKTLVAGFARLDLPCPTLRGRPRIHPIHQTQGA